jgi:hypothetical protein
VIETFMPIPPSPLAPSLGCVVEFTLGFTLEPGSNPLRERA